MKIHQTIGLVAGVHALAFLVIFVNPGCSSTTQQQAASSGPALAAAAPAPATDPAPAAPSPAVDGSGSPGLVPVSGGGNAFYSPTRPNTPAAEALAPAAPAPEVTPTESYTVKSGDSLWLVAHHHHIKVSELAAANNLRSTSSLHPGQKLLIPQAAGSASPEPASARGASTAMNAPALTGAADGAGTPGAKAGGPTKYTVRAGDKLSSIAHRYGLTTGTLAAENNISDARKIRPGQVLIIPAGGSLRKAGAKHTHSAARPAETAAETAPAPSSAPALEPVAPPPAAPSAGGDASSVPLIRIDGSGANAPSSAPAH